MKKLAYCMTIMALLDFGNAPSYAAIGRRLSTEMQAEPSGGAVQFLS